MVFHGKARRLVLGLLVAILLALFVREAAAQMIPTPPICKETTPADYEWWLHFCFNYPSTPSVLQRGVVVR